MLVVDQNVVVIRCEAKHQQTSTGLCQPNDQTFPRRAFVSPDGRDVAPNEVAAQNDGRRRRQRQ
jgi:hypothetical protein